MIISSQRFLDDEIVEAKRIVQDYEVKITPVFSFRGLRLQVIMDGHHAYHAAKIDKVKPVFIVDDSYRVGRGQVEVFLEESRNDSDYYNIRTGKEVF